MKTPGFTLFFATLWLWSMGHLAHAQSQGMGLTVLAEDARHGPITVFYPSRSADTPVSRGPFTVNVAEQGSVAEGNRRLLLLSHGSGGNPWPMSELARSLVKAGYTVAVPEHDGDNHRDMHLVGPASWQRRPAEISAAIDAVQADARFAPLLDFTQVGVYGTSAGGITALVMAGAQWSPSRFQQHCLAHMEDDFNACVGLATQLTGGWADSLKVGVARLVHRVRFGDTTVYQHTDARVRAVVASVPMATPIDPQSLAQPQVAIGLMRAGQDRWLHPQFHVDALRPACPSCEWLMDDPQAGHGSLFSPWPAELAASLTPLLVDPPSFQRDRLPAVYERVVQFFDRHLVTR